MNILIYGAGAKGKLALELISKEYRNRYNVVGFIDKNKCGTCQGYPIFKPESMEKFEGKIVIALWDLESAQEVCQRLKKKGYKDIFWFQDKRPLYQYEDFFTEQCRACVDWGDSILPQVEMHIIDSCNLNCRGCSHFSPIFPGNLPDLNLRLGDVKKLKEKVSCVLRFYILGGEPFLNPEIGSYVSNIRKIFPYTQLYIVTNGLLIEHVSREILQRIKDNHVWISISEYEPTHDRIDKICHILNEHGIMYEIRGALRKEKFCLPLSLSQNSRYPRTCISNRCVTIWNGKIARCPQLMYIAYFNSYFHTHLPEDGVMDLENCAKGQELLCMLQEEVLLCRHCVKNEIEWSRCGKPVRLEDFAVLD